MGNIPVKLFWCSGSGGDVFFFFFFFFFFKLTDIRRPITIVYLEPLGLVS